MIQTIVEQLSSMENISRKNANLNQNWPDATVGVPMGKLRELAKVYREENIDLIKLWNTEIPEAQFFCIMLSNPKTLKYEHAYYFLKQCSFTALQDELILKLLSKTPHSKKLYEMIDPTESDLSRRALWTFIVADIADTKKNAERNWEHVLKQVQFELVDSKPLTQWMMNRALAEIGFRYSNYTEQCIEIGRNLGVYEQQVVAKGCTSAYVPNWIEAVLKRK